MSEPAFFQDLSLVSLMAVFAGFAAVVWIAGSKLAVIGDEIAERTRLAQDFIGLVFLATVTELPEIVTTFTAARIDNAALVLGNLFGGITMNTAILAIADFFVVRNALTSWPRKPTHALVGALLIVMLSLLLAVSIAGDLNLSPAVGIGAVALSLGFPLVIWLQKRFDERTSWAPVDLPDEESDDTQSPLPPARMRTLSAAGLTITALAFAALVLVAGTGLGLAADAIAEKSGLGSSFIGVTLLATSTSLPELSATIAAARIGAYTMAIANIFGSNLIMIALLLPADIAYGPGPILADVHPAAQFSLVTGILVTAIYVAGILIRRTPKIMGAGVDSWLVFLIWIGSLFVLRAMTA